MKYVISILLILPLSLLTIISNIIGFCVVVCFGLKGKLNPRMIRNALFMLKENIKEFNEERDK